MKTQLGSRISIWFSFSLACVFSACLLATTVPGQRVAILTPHKNAGDIEYAQQLEESIAAPIRILDNAQTDTAFRSVEIGDVFNMNVAEAKSAAAVMGCDFFLLIRTGAQRRSSFSKPDYYEAFAAHYLVSGRTGALLSWFLKSLEADDPDKAERMLDASVSDTAKDIAEKIKAANLEELHPPASIQIETVPDDGSPAAVNLKPPIPYRRIKPEYTPTAFLYDVRATIDIEADIDVDGKIIATRIVRWAGFGLEGSVEKAVRQMNWRPAMRNGKALPMRVLLRYNFTKVG